MRKLISPLLILAIGCSTPCTDDESLKELAHESVSDHLEAPATAKFTKDKVHSVETGDGVVITGAVDVQNKYGVPLRSKYGVHVKCSAGMPFVAYAWMEDAEWGKEYERHWTVLETMDKAAAEAEAAAAAALEASLSDEERASAAVIAAQEAVIAAQEEARAKVENVHIDSLQRAQEELRATYQ